MTVGLPYTFRKKTWLLQGGGMLPNAKVAPEMSTEKSGVKLLADMAEVRGVAAHFTRGTDGGLDFVHVVLELHTTVAFVHMKS